MAARYELLRGARATEPRDSARRARHPSSARLLEHLIQPAAAGRVLRAALVIGGVCAVAALCAASLTPGRGDGPAPAPVEVAGRLDELEAKFDLPEVGLEAYGKLLRGNDPFRFQCPLPGPLSALNGTGLASSPSPLSGGLRRPSELDDVECCLQYERLAWPFQFPECAGKTSCSTCFRQSSTAGLARHSAAGLAAVAWASSLSVRGRAKPQGLVSHISSGVASFIHDHLTDGPELEQSKVLHDQKMKGVLANGLHRDYHTDLCPKIGDWEVHMLNEEEENIHARVFKSPSAKLAIVAFRGTQAGSMKNWEVDADISRVELLLENTSSAGGQALNSTLVHKGFLEALMRVLPLVKAWVSRGGSQFKSEPVPSGWTLVFTGHSMGGALALLAATLAEAQGWSRRPDATVVFGTPRVADHRLSQWWEAKQLCPKLLRVNTYNDVIHWTPFMRGMSWWQEGTSLFGCLSDMKACLQQEPQGSGDDGGAAFSSRWRHVCDESEVVIPSALKGVNEHLKELSPVGGLLAHFMANCRFGYGYGVMHGGIADSDAHCGIGPGLCPAVR